MVSASCSNASKVSLDPYATSSGPKPEPEVRSAVVKYMAFEPSQTEVILVPTTYQLGNFE